MNLILTVHEKGERFEYAIAYAGHPLEKQCVTDTPALSELESSIETIYSVTSQFVPSFSQVQASQLAEEARSLYSNIFPSGIRDVLSRSSAGTLLLRTTSSLSRVPWELLHDGESFLGERFGIGRITSVEDFAPGTRATRDDKTITLMSANPQGDLPWVHEEIDRLYRLLLRKRRWVEPSLRARVDLDTLKSHLLSANLVHFAGHCRYDPDEQAESGWQLEDGIFTPNHVQSLVDCPPSLVFANACISGATSFSAMGQNISSMAEAFLKAGVRHYIGPVTPLPDAGAIEFAHSFYKNLVEGFAIGEALRRARVELKQRRKGSSLFRLSYVLFGDPSHTYFPKTQVRKLTAARKAQIGSELVHDFRKESFLYPRQSMEEFFQKHFVRVNLRRYRGNESVTQKDLLEKLGQDKRMLLLGNMGSGKTTLALWLAHMCNQKEFPFATHTPLPLFLKAREFVDGSSLCWERFEKKFGAPFEELSRSPLLIILDGLDEATREQNQEEYGSHLLGEEILQTIDEIRSLFFIITSREPDAGPLKHFPLRNLFTAWELMPLRSRIALPEGLEKTPLNVALWASLSDREKKRIPSRAHLYRFYTQQTLKREAGLGKVPVAAEEALQFLEGVAWEMTLQGESGLDEVRVLSHLPFDRDELAFPFLVKDSLHGTVSFVHPSLQAYFAAEKIVHDPFALDGKSLKDSRFFDGLCFAYELLSGGRPDPGLKVKVGASLAYLLQDRKKSKEADTILKQVEHYSRRHKLKSSPFYERERAELFQSQAQLAYYDGDYWKSLSFLNDALTLLASLQEAQEEHPELTQKVMNQAACVLLDIYDLAYAQRASAIALRLSDEDTEDEARACGTLGRVALKAKHFDLCLDMFLKKREIHRVIERDEEVVRDNLDLVLLYSIADEETKSATELENVERGGLSAVQLYQRRQDFPNLAYAVRNMAMLSAALNDGKLKDWTKRGVRLHAEATIDDTCPLAFFHLLQKNFEKSIATFEAGKYYLEAALAEINWLINGGRWQSARIRKNLLTRFFRKYAGWAEKFPELSQFIDGSSPAECRSFKVFPTPPYGDVIREIEKNLEDGELEKIADTLVLI